MDASVRVPALPLVLPTSQQEEKLRKIYFLDTFGNELMMLGIFIIILLVLYYVYWQTRSVSETLQRRRTRVQKLFDLSNSSMELERNESVESPV